MDSPLPLRDGIAASYLWLPEGVAGRLLDFLCQRFSDVSAATWQARLRKNEVCDQDGTPLHADSPARRGMCIFYYRETEQETPIPFQAQILHQDQHLLVVDKPHFLPVTPGGRFLHETLLVRLKKQTGLSHLSPIHRLDRETAGVILFSLNPASRGAYQELFARRQISKTYQALAPALPATLFPLIHRSRMSEGSHFFTMQESAGLPNSETRIDIAEQRGALNLYTLQPLTGKKHQLRVHMASLGAPIVNDSFYPVALPCKGDDFNTPLQLLASSIAFIDPHSGQARQFHSKRSLTAADEHVQAIDKRGQQG